MDSSNSYAGVVNAYLFTQLPLIYNNKGNSTKLFILS